MISDLLMTHNINPQRLQSLNENHQRMLQINGHVLAFVIYGYLQISCGLDSHLP
jgi:hypothetical protein